MRMNVSLPLAVLLHRLNSVLRAGPLLPSRGVRPGVPVSAHDRLASGIRMAAAQASEFGMKKLRRRYCDGAWWPRDGEVVLFNLVR